MSSDSGKEVAVSEREGCELSLWLIRKDTACVGTKKTCGMYRPVRSQRPWDGEDSSSYGRTIKQSFMPHFGKKPAFQTSPRAHQDSSPHCWQKGTAWLSASAVLPVQDIPAGLALSSTSDVAYNEKIK